MKKCCLRTLIALLIVVVIIAAGIIVLLNLTPAQLHVDGISLGGNTLADYGLSDVKIIKIIKGARSLNKKESDVVKNGYDQEQEKSAVAALFANSNLSDAENYAELLNQNAVFSQRYVRVLNDTTLAYVLDSALRETYPSFAVREVTITKQTADDGSSIGHLRLVAGVDTAAYIPSSVKDTMAKVRIKLPTYIYVVFDADFSVFASGENQGKMLFANMDASVGGDKDNVLNDVLIHFIAKTAGISTSEDGDKAAFSRAIFDKASACINHIGAIGNANASADGVVAGSITYGMVGVDDHKVRLITYTTH